MVLASADVGQPPCQTIKERGENSETGLAAGSESRPLLTHCYSPFPGEFFGRGTDSHASYHMFGEYGCTKPSTHRQSALQGQGRNSRAAASLIDDQRPGAYRQQRWTAYPVLQTCS